MESISLNNAELKKFKRSNLEVFFLNILIPILALTSIFICLLPEMGLAPFWLIFTLNIVLTTQIAIITHELIHEPNTKTWWNFPLRINFHIYSPFTLGFAEYKKLHGLHHTNANNPETDPDFFFIKGGRIRAFFTLAFAPEYLFFYVLRNGLTQPGFYIFHALRLVIFSGYLYILGVETFFLLFFIPAKLAWGIGFLFFSYESHVDEAGMREGSYNLEPRSALLRAILKMSVGPYAYYVAFSHASHHDYPQISGRKIGKLVKYLQAHDRKLPSRRIRIGKLLTL